MAMAIFAVVTTTAAYAAVRLCKWRKRIGLMTVMTAAELCKVVLVPECNIPVAKFVSCIETDPTASPLRFQVSSMGIPIDRAASASSYVVEVASWQAGARNRAGAAGAGAAWEEIRTGAAAGAAEEARAAGAGAAWEAIARAAGAAGAWEKLRAGAFAVMTVVAFRFKFLFAPCVTANWTDRKFAGYRPQETSTDAVVLSMPIIYFAMATSATAYAVTVNIMEFVVEFSICVPTIGSITACVDVG